MILVKINYCEVGINYVIINAIYDSTSKTQILLQRANFAWRHVVKFAAEIAR